MYIFAKILTSSLGSVHQGLADLAFSEHAWCLDIVPVLAGERVDTEIKFNGYIRPSDIFVNGKISFPQCKELNLEYTEV